jgi:hypothetical protein
VTFTGLPLPVVAALGGGVAVMIILLYTVRWRLPRRTVSTVQFWTSSRASDNRSGQLGRLEHLLSLLLQLTIAALLVGALAQPRFSFQSAPARSVAIVLDRSASMNALDGGEPRLARAQRRLVERLARASATDKVGLVLAGGEPELAVPLSADSALVRTVATRASLHGGAGRLADAVGRACGMLGGRQPASLVVITDGTEPVGECAGAELETIVVAEHDALDNVGIVAFAAAELPRDGRRAEAYVEVLNASRARATAELRLDLDGSLQRVARLTIPPGERARQVFVDLGVGAGRRLIARLAQIHFEDGAKDALAADDVAYALLPQRERVRVDLIGRDPASVGPLELALQAWPQLQVTARPAPSGAADVNVIVGAPPSPLAAGRYLLIDPKGANAPISVGARVAAPAITRWRDDHPILRGAVVSDLLVGEASRLELPAGATAIVSSNETPLLFALDDGERRVVGLGFPLERSNLPLRVGFPVILYNAIDWLGAHRAGRGPAGELESASPIELTPPDGKPRTLAPVDGRVRIDTGAPGFYRATASGKPVGEWATSVADAGETRLQSSAPKGTAAQAGRRRDAELGHVLLLLATLLLLIEWATFHRRKTV